MLTGQELIHALLIPAVVAGFLAAIGRWRRWTWAVPLAVGAGFLAGYALFRLPGLPPRDGTDWLFWLAIPLTLLAMMEAVAQRGGGSDNAVRESFGRWTWAFGVAAGVVALVIILPLARVGTVSTAATIGAPVLLAAAGALLILLLRFAIDRLGPAATVAGLCIVVGGAGVLVMSSNLRIVGIYGLSCAAALGGVAVLCRDRGAARGVATLVVPLLAGLLTAGRYYPEPGVRWAHFAMIFAAPLLLAAAAVIPTKRTRLRAVLAVLAVAILVGAVTIPLAIAARRAAEADPYGAYY